MAVTTAHDGLDARWRNLGQWDGFQFAVDVFEQKNGQRSMPLYGAVVFSDSDIRGRWDEILLEWGDSTPHDSFPTRHFLPLPSLNLPWSPHRRTDVWVAAAVVPITVRIALTRADATDPTTALDSMALGSVFECTFAANTKGFARVKVSKGGA